MEEFKDIIAVVTGGAPGIGRCIADEFQKASSQERTSASTVA
jgi:NADP-dependent 3-hydroxy acid dehydrogenase YdfG